MSSDLKIAAVFATMNRAETSKSCVLALAAQTRPPELVVVADNDSNDDTVGVLRSLMNLPFQLIVINMPENRGNAGGVEEAMDRAFAEGMDAVWILDDDSLPESSALVELVSNQWDPLVVRHSIQIDPKSGEFTWPMQVWFGDRFKLVNSREELPSGDFVRTRIMWTGALVSKEVRAVVGRVNAGLFIRGEDEEYPWRMEKAGFPQEAAVRSVLSHPGPVGLVHWKLLGRSLFLEKGLSDWKLYYKIRNMVWLRLRQSGWLGAFTIAAAYAVAVSCIDGPHRLRLISGAIRDGLVGRLGKWSGH
jgi:rhamnopyranosyl-N-acetylglucosaminyl-diphospho-decaprenol beta-1,3/1,4-galactofuranosyltransferase